MPLKLKPRVCGCKVNPIFRQSLISWQKDFFFEEISQIRCSYNEYNQNVIDNKPRWFQLTTTLVYQKLEGIQQLSYKSESKILSMELATCNRSKNHEMCAPAVKHQTWKILITHTSKFAALQSRRTHAACKVKKFKKATQFSLNYRTGRSKNFL